MQIVELMGLSQFPCYVTLLSKFWYLGSFWQTWLYTSVQKLMKSVIYRIRESVF